MVCRYSSASSSWPSLSLFTFTSPSCSGPPLAEGVRVDAIVWLLQHLELFVSSFLPSVLQGCSPTEVCSRHCFGWCLGGQSGTLDSVTRILIDQSACLVEPSLLFRASCCPAASTFGAVVAARESPSRSLSLLSLHRAFPAAHLAFWRLDTFCASSHTFDTGFLLLDVVLPTQFFQPRVACLRHQTLLICWHILLVLSLGLVLSMAKSALNSSSRP